MKKFQQLIPGLIMLGASQAVSANDEEDILEVFEQYRVAILAANGEAAYDLVDKTTRDYYDRILDSVRYASEEESRSMSKLEKLFVLRSRHQISKDNLSSWDGESYFQHAVDSGWIDKGSVSTTEITDIEITGDAASSKLQQDEDVAPFGFEFNRESSGWKLNLISVFSLGEMTLDTIVKQSESKEDDVIVSIVESISGEKVNESIWTAPFERP